MSITVMTSHCQICVSLLFEIKKYLKLDINYLVMNVFINTLCINEHTSMDYFFVA